MSKRWVAAAAALVASTALQAQRNPPGKFGWIHELACPSENELYVAELLNWRAQKLLLKPGS